MVGGFVMRAIIIPSTLHEEAGQGSQIRIAVITRIPKDRLRSPILASLIRTGLE